MTHTSTTAAATAIEEQCLSEQARGALTAELFARWHAAEPDQHHCFAGSDRDLIAAVEQLRDTPDRHTQDRHTDDRDHQDRERG